MANLDHGSKRMSERDRRAFLALAGCLGLDEAATVRQFEREIVPGQKIADHLYRIRRSPTGPEQVEHIESVARWKPREVNKILERALSISLVPRLRSLDIHTWIIVMTENDAPAVFPKTFTRMRGALRCYLRIRYKLIRKTWAKWIFQLGRIALLPLVPLCRHTWRDLEKAAELLRQEGDEDLISQFLSNARVRYAEEEIARIEKMLFERETVEILAGTKAGKKLVRDTRKDATRKGIEKGVDKGRLIGIQDAIRQVLEDRFPALVNAAAIDRIDDYEQARKLFASLLSAKSEREARRALSLPVNGR